LGGGGVVCDLGVKCVWWQDHENSQRLINKFTSGTLANAGWKKTQNDNGFYDLQCKTKKPFESYPKGFVELYYL